MRAITLDGILASRNLPSLPRVAMDVLELTRDPEVALSDIAAVVQKFVGLLDPIKARAQLTPNLLDPLDLVDFRDIAAAVAAFVDSIYPYSGPLACP